MIVSALLGVWTGHFLLSITPLRIWPELTCFLLFCFLSPYCHSPTVLHLLFFNPSRCQHQLLLFFLLLCSLCLKMVSMKQEKPSLPGETFPTFCFFPAMPCFLWACVKKATVWELSLKNFKFRPKKYNLRRSPPERKYLLLFLFSTFCFSADCCLFFPLNLHVFPPSLPVKLGNPPSPSIVCLPSLTRCLSRPPSFSLHLSFSAPLLLLLFFLSVDPSLSSLHLLLPQIAATVTWSCQRCVTNPKGWTSCRPKPSSPGRSFSLFIEASRTYVKLWRGRSLLLSLLCF